MGIRVENVEPEASGFAECCCFFLVRVARVHVNFGLWACSVWGLWLVVLGLRAYGLGFRTWTWSFGVGEISGFLGGGGIVHRSLGFTRVSV